MTEPISITLPRPVSANKYWRTYMPRGFRAPVTTLSDEAKAYKREVAKLATLAGIRAPIPGRVSIVVRMYPQRPKDWAKRAEKDPNGWDNTVKCIDLDNSLKVTLDALKGIAFEDDDQVFGIVAKRMTPDGDARLEVTVTPVEVPYD